MIKGASNNQELGWVGMSKRKKVGVSPMLATILLVVMVFLLGVGVSLIYGRMEGVSFGKIPNTLLQIWRHFPGKGGIGVISVKGDKIPNAFYADFITDTPMGTLFENVRWKDMEVKVNGQEVENELEYILYSAPLPESKKTKDALLDFPSGGGAVVFSYTQGFLDRGDEVAVVYRPTGWIMAEAEMEDPLYCTESGGIPGSNLVDSGIQLRLLWVLELENKVVDALTPHVENRVHENCRWYVENFDEARSYVPKIEGLVEEVHQWLENSKSTGGVLENDLKELYNYLPLVDMSRYYKLCMCYKKGLLNMLIDGLENIYNMEVGWLRAFDPSYVSDNWTRSVMENAREISLSLQKLVDDIEAKMEEGPYPVPMKAIEYFGVSPAMDDIYEDLYRPALAPYLENAYWVADNFVWEVYVYNVGTENCINVTRVADIWYDPENEWWVSEYFDCDSTNWTVSVAPENWLVPMGHGENIHKWGTRMYDNTYHNRYRYTARLKIAEWLWSRLTHSYREYLSPESDYFELQIPYGGEGGKAIRYIVLTRNVDNINAGSVWFDNITVPNLPAEMENQIWLEDYYFVYTHPKTGDREWQYFWNVHWVGQRGEPPGGEEGGC